MTKNLKNIFTLITNINDNPAATRLKNYLSKPLGVILVRLRISPTLLNIFGLITGIFTAFSIGLGNLPLGALIFLLSGLADAMDGTVARIRGVENNFGAFFDSVCDRYVDTAVFLGISWYFMQQQAYLYVFLSFCGLVGTVVTSYARARAESLSLASRYVGLMNRPERVILLLIGLAFPITLPWIIWILAILTNFTAVHRVLFYSMQFRQENQ